MALASILLNPVALAPRFSSSSAPFPNTFTSGLGTRRTLKVSFPNSVPLLDTFKVILAAEGTMVTLPRFWPAIASPPSALNDGFHKAPKPAETTLKRFAQPK